MNAWTIIGLSILGGLGLLTIMGRLCGRNPGVIGPEIDSPFFDANVDSLLPPPIRSQTVRANGSSFAEANHPASVLAETI